MQGVTYHHSDQLHDSGMCDVCVNLEYSKHPS